MLNAAKSGDSLIIASSLIFLLQKKYNPMRVVGKPWWAWFAILGNYERTLLSDRGLFFRDLQGRIPPLERVPF
jgi:hypothetical protein